MNINNPRQEELLNINKKINEYDEKKIDILRKVPFKKWNRVTFLLNELSEYYMVLINLQDELKYSSITYKDIEEREEKKREILLDIRETQDSMRPYLEERNIILNEYLTFEECNDLQNIYVNIYSLEKIKTDRDKLKKLLNNKDFYEQK
ncbi:hypothetical protein [Clostridium frigidicarnis]|uniref:Uncharacterized protein n=1 Tax=Clostridium frigidicarnis TaxID=84698 RepID=A0A1I0WW73_9CLOT|nr:hypothetical protein [Clostridium frigidicarnis]SFA92979.1 hypothetical protein SAMN04488528_1006116 [Clostridium frigidicarnis]